MSDSYQLKTEKTRIELPGTEFDIDDWAEKVVETQELLEKKGFKHRGGVHHNINSFSSRTDYRKEMQKRIGSTDRMIQTPVPNSLSSAGADYINDEDERQIYIDVKTTDIEKRKVEELDHHPHSSAVEQLEDEEVVGYEAAVTPIVVAEDENGYAALGENISEENWYNAVSSEGFSNMEKGPTRVWMNYETPEEVSIMVTHSNGSSTNPLFEGVVDEIDESLERYAEFSEGVNYRGEGLGQFELDVDMTGSPEEAAERVETAYTAVKKALEESVNYEI